MALLISEHTALFGFIEQGYRLEIVIAIVAEAVTIVALSVFLALDCYAPRPDARRAAPPGRRIRGGPPSPATEPQ